MRPVPPPSSSLRCGSLTEARLSIMRAPLPVEAQRACELGLLDLAVDRVLADLDDVDRAARREEDPAAERGDQDCDHDGSQCYALLEPLHGVTSAGGFSDPEHGWI